MSDNSKERPDENLEMPGRAEVHAMIGKPEREVARENERESEGVRERNRERELQALKEAVAEVVEKHRRDGRPLAVWQDGKAVLVSPGKPARVHESRAPYRTRSHGKKS